MDWALGELKARRYEAVLWVLSDNLNARRFYSADSGMTGR